MRQDCPISSCSIKLARITARRRLRVCYLGDLQTYRWRKFMSINSDSYHTLSYNIQAVKRAAEVKIKLLEALADIPERIYDAERYRELYADTRAEKLTGKTVELCSAIVHALRLMIVYLDEKKFSTCTTNVNCLKQELATETDRCD